MEKKTSMLEKKVRMKPRSRKKNKDSRKNDNVQENTLSTKESDQEKSKNFLFDRFLGRERIFFTVVVFS